MFTGLDASNDGHLRWHDGERKHFRRGTASRPGPLLRRPAGHRVPYGHVGSAVGRQQGGALEEAVARGDQ